jgi:hypothetical protein
VRVYELSVGVGLYALALKEYLAKLGSELANQAAQGIQTIVVRPSTTRTFPILFLPFLLVFLALPGDGTTLEPLAFRAQLLETGFDGRELCSGTLQPATRLLLCLLAACSPLFSADARLLKAP